MIDGERGCSCHGVLENSQYLTKAYCQEVLALCDKYYPLEVDLTLSETQRTAYMVEWWESAHKALTNAGLTRGNLTATVAEARIALRSGYAELIEYVSAMQLPLLIFSAGISNVLEEVLQQHAKDVILPVTAHIVSNQMEFDSNTGAFKGFTGELIHVFNKSASSIRHAPYFQADGLAQRDHVILLGDSLGDIRMSEVRKRC